MKKREARFCHLTDVKVNRILDSERKQQEGSHQSACNWQLSTVRWPMVGDQSQRRWNPRDLWRVTWQTNTGRTAQHECKLQTARASIVRNCTSPSGSCNFAVLEKFTRTYWRNRKRAECIVELYKHAGIFKNTREVRRSTSVLKNSPVLIELNNTWGTSFFISFIKYVVNFARSYRWRRLRALYLNSALVWRKARALWKYNELVKTNHSALISLNILY